MRRNTTLGDLAGLDAFFDTTRLQPIVQQRVEARLDAEILPAPTSPDPQYEDVMAFLQQYHPAVYRESLAYFAEIDDFDRFDGDLAGLVERDEQGNLIK